MRLAVTLAAAALATLCAAPLVAAQAEDREIPEMTEEMLSDPEAIALGRDLFADQCTLCHGRTAYPGKAPMLEPRRYDAEFTYDRIAYGFRDMPPWKDMFDEDDLIALVAYIMSDRFAH